MAAVSAPSEREIRSVLDVDPIWSAYAVGDLRTDFAPYCQWRIAERSQGKGLVMLFSRLSPPALFAIGDAGAVARALDEQELPDAVYLLVRHEHFEIVSRRYEIAPTDVRNMWRMHLTRPAAAKGRPPLPDGYAVRPLGMDDSERMMRLYAHGGPYAPDAFDPYQVADGAFFGVTDAEGEVVASGGTHVVDCQAGVAAIGNMYTHPAQRGRGFGAAVLQAIVERLLRGGVTNIVLNVDERNPGARRLYEKHGFEAYCPYLEGPAIRKDQG